MKYHLTYFFFIICAFQLAHTDDSCQISADMTYSCFKIKFNKPAYQPEEQSQREQNFIFNMQNLKKKMKQGFDFYGVNGLHDQNLTQFKNRLGLQLDDNQQFNLNPFVSVRKGTNQVPQQIKNDANLIQVGDSYPSSKNWADEGKITSIKDQGSCGTCWSFATTAAVQTALILKGQVIKFFSYQPDLSQQFLLTCATHGTCKGGYLQQSIDLAYQKGLPYQSDVPYLGYKGDQKICSNTGSNVKYTDSNTARYSYYDIKDDQIIGLLQKGPLMIAVSADNWQNYGGGVFQCASTSKVNHAVLLVGYDSTKWVIKNQWGTSWGNNGYIYVTRTKNRNCQIGVAVHQLSGNNLIISLVLMFLTLFLIV